MYNLRNPLNFSIWNRSDKKSYSNPFQCIVLQCTVCILMSALSNVEQQFTCLTHKKIDKKTHGNKLSCIIC